MESPRMPSITSPLGSLLALALVLATPYAYAEDSTARGVVEPANSIESGGRSEAPTQGKRNTPVLVSGIVATSLGGMGLMMGSVALVIADASSTQVCENGSCHPATESDREGMRTVGWVGLVSGVVLAGVGIPLIIVGAKRRSLEPSEQTAELRLLATPGGGALHLTF
jgi:hypothetical protein